MEQGLIGRDRPVIALDQSMPAHCSAAATAGMSTLSRTDARGPAPSVSCTGRVVLRRSRKGSCRESGWWSTRAIRSVRGSGLVPN